MIEESARTSQVSTLTHHDLDEPLWIVASEDWTTQKDTTSMLAHDHPANSVCPQLTVTEGTISQRNIVNDKGSAGEDDRGDNDSATMHK